MPIKCLLVLAGSLLMAVAAQAQEAMPLPPAVSDAVYKGVVGKVLDAVPMDPQERVTLQRTGAVVSGATTGRSLAVWAGFTNPVLLIAGAVWGLFSASNIKAAAESVRVVKMAAKPGAPRRIAPGEPVETATAEKAQVALLAVATEGAKNDQ